MPTAYRGPDVGDRVSFECALCGECEPSQPGYLSGLPGGGRILVFDPPPTWGTLSRSHCPDCLRLGRVRVSPICAACTRKVAS